MKDRYIINLNNIDDLQNFLHEITYHISSDVDAVFERQVLDAKSINGLLSISYHPITAIIHTVDENELAKFKEICERYEVKA